MSVPTRCSKVNRSLANFITALTALFLGCFVLLPLWQILAGALADSDGRPTLLYPSELSQDAAYLEGLVNALGLSAATTLLALLVALPLALAAGALRVSA